MRAQSMIVHDRVGYGGDQRFVIETLYEVATLTRYMFKTYSHLGRVNLKRLM